MHRTFIAQQTKAIPRLVQSTRTLRTSAITMSSSSSNEYGQGKSHATGDSVVPEAVQRQAPKAVEENLPNSVHDTGKSGEPKTHAKDGGQDSIVPIGIQKAVPESVERALPDSIHNTGDSKK